MSNQSVKINDHLKSIEKLIDTYSSDDTCFDIDFSEIKNSIAKDMSLDNLEFIYSCLLCKIFVDNNTGSTGCGNCEHNCCCRCKNNNCYFCKIRPNAPEHLFYSEKCANMPYKSHFVCFYCRIGTKDKRYCNRCKKYCIRVHNSVRMPKRNDASGWKLLELLLVKNTFAKSKAGTLAHFWHKNQGLGCGMHYPRYFREMFIIPKKMGEYKQWIEHMNNTNVPNEFLSIQ